MGLKLNKEKNMEVEKLIQLLIETAETRKNQVTRYALLKAAEKLQFDIGRNELPD